MSTYASIKSLHTSLPAYAPVVPTSLLPWIALLTLSAFFALTFTFTTSTLLLPASFLCAVLITALRLPKRSNPLPEVGIASLASVLAGGGIVALFCTLGVYV